MTLVSWLDPVQLPYLTASQPGIGGTLKENLDDFRVEEIPLHEPSGQGRHLYLELEKRGLSTPEAINVLTRTWSLKRHAIGYAGLKDRRALTRQHISVEGLKPQQLKYLRHPAISLRVLGRHPDKLKLGQLRCNRFVVRLRRLNTDPQTAQQQAQAILDILQKRGVPNYFGSQRFGNRRDNHILGYYLLANQYNAFIDRFLGNAHPDDLPMLARARRLYDQGQYGKAHKTWPYGFHEQRQALQTLIRSNGNKRKATAGVNGFLQRLLVSAFQSYIFNLITAERLSEIDALWDGDIAYQHNTDTCFPVENTADHQSSIQSFAISATAPLPGYCISPPQGRPAQLEQKILDHVNMTDTLWQQIKRFDVKGNRRPIRFPIVGLKVSAQRDKKGHFLSLGFELPSGCYATALLREVMKNDCDDSD